MNQTTNAISIKLANGNKETVIIVKEGVWEKIDISHITPNDLPIAKINSTSSNDIDNVKLSDDIVQTSSSSPKSCEHSNSVTLSTINKVSSQKPIIITEELVVKKFIDGIKKGVYQIKMHKNGIFMTDLYTYFQNWCKIKKYQWKSRMHHFKLMVEKYHTKATKLSINYSYRLGFKF